MTTRYNRMLNNFDKLFMILEMILEKNNQTQKSFLTKEKREELIDDLVNTRLECDNCSDMLRDGFAGYNNFSDYELIDEQMSMTYDCEDEEWDDCYPQYIVLESIINEALNLLMSEAIEVTILK